MAAKSHYEILGLTDSATAEEIKKQYRTLARKYHPDVNPGDSTAAARFAGIAEAYKILSDPDARKFYDAERALQNRPAFPNRSTNTTATSGTSRQQQSQGSTQTSASLEAERLVQQAQAAFMKGRMAEARNLAESSLRYNRRNAVAYEILGDINRVQGRPDDAMSQYTIALQYDPRSAAVRQKFDRLAKTPSQSSSGGYVPTTPPRPSASGTTSTRSRSAPIASNVAPHKRPLVNVLVGFFGYFGSFLVLLFHTMQEKSLSETHALPLPFIATWSWSLIGAMALIGVLLGATMTITGAIRRIEDELLLIGSSGGPKQAPLGVLILTLGVICFPIAAIIHLLVALMQELLSVSLARFYGTIAALTLIFAVTYPVPGIVLGGGIGQTLVFGGNVLFASFVVGWLLGDFFRPD